MKKTILSTLLFAAFAVQSAAAAVRTFEYTAVVNYVQAGSDRGPTITGPDGNPLSQGDLVLGRFSFDDLGRDWTGTPADVRDLDVLDFRVKFASTDSSFSFPYVKWSHYQSSSGSDLYIMPILLVPSPPPIVLSFHSPATVPFWDFANGATADLSAAWYDDNTGRAFFGAAVTGISEVSAVPEPSAYAMLLLGLGVAGAAAYRRRSSQA